MYQCHTYFFSFCYCEVKRSYIIHIKVSKEETIEAIKNNLVPKGNVFEMAKTAGLFAVKKTSDMIPDCHPLPVEFTGVSYEIDGLKIKILLIGYFLR